MRLSENLVARCQDRRGIAAGELTFCDLRLDDCLTGSGRCAVDHAIVDTVTHRIVDVVGIVFKTTNGGQAWQPVFQTTNNQNIQTGWSGYRGDEDWWYGEYALGFTVAPTNPDVAIITDLGFAHVTTDGGASWRQMYVASDDENPAGTSTPCWLPIRNKLHSLGKGLDSIEALLLAASFGGF